MSRRTEAKKARRQKRRATRDARWFPDSVIEDLATAQVEVAAGLEAFDERITERGWDFDDELSDETIAIWYFAPSFIEIDEESVQAATGVALMAEEDGEMVHLVFVGSSEHYGLTQDEFFEHIDTIEAYRAGDPPPAFA